MFPNFSWSLHFCLLSLVTLPFSINVPPYPSYSTAALLLTYYELGNQIIKLFINKESINVGRRSQVSPVKFMTTLLAFCPLAGPGELTFSQVVSVIIHNDHPLNRFLSGTKIAKRVKRNWLYTKVLLLFYIKVFKKKIICESNYWEFLFKYVKAI